MVCKFNPIVFLRVKEIMDFSATTITERTSLGQRQSVESESKDKMCIM